MGPNGRLLLNGKGQHFSFPNSAFDEIGFQFFSVTRFSNVTVYVQMQI